MLRWPCCGRRPAAVRVAVRPDADAEAALDARPARRSTRLSVGELPAEFEMWVLPLSELMKMPVFEPHEELRRAGRLVRWDPSMKVTWFLSHAWASFSHPDPSAEQLRAFKRLVVRMMAGKVGDTAREPRRGMEMRGCRFFQCLLASVPPLGLRLRHSQMRRTWAPVRRFLRSSGSACCRRSRCTCGWTTVRHRK